MRRKNGLLSGLARSLLLLQCWAAAGWAAVRYSAVLYCTVLHGVTVGTARNAWTGLQVYLVWRLGGRPDPRVEQPPRFKANPKRVCGPLNERKFVLGLSRFVLLTQDSREQ